MSNKTLRSDKKLKNISEVFILINVSSYFLALYEGMEYLIFIMLFVNFFMILAFNIKISKHKDMIFFSAVLLFFIVFSRNTEYIIIFITTLFFCQLDFKVITRRIAFYCLCFFLLFIIFRLNEYQVYMRGDGSYRYDLGFVNPNILAKYALGIIISLFCLKLNFSAIFFGLAIGFISGSRTLLIVTLLYPIVLIVLRFRYKILNFVWLLLFPILTFISIMAALQSAIYVDIDKLLSFRPRGWLIYLNEYGFSLFGKTILFQDAVALDNSYLNIFISLGFMGTFLFSLFYYILIRKLIKGEQLILLSCVILTLIYSFFENILKYPLFNIATIYAVVLTHKSKYNYK